MPKTTTKPGTGAVPRTIADAAAALRAGTVTSTELTAGLFDRIARLNDQVGAYVTLCEEAALSAAAEADARFAVGEMRSALDGVPLAVKDIIATSDAPTRANSAVSDPDWYAGADAPAVARLRAAGAVILGKATTNEFACALPEPTDDPLPRNPWNLDHTPMGSSSGTAIAVSAGLALGGLGTDTGGSIRGPASATGCTGLKVSYGRVPKTGVIPCAFSLDTVGPMARSAYDCAVILDAIAGHHHADPHSADVPVDGYAASAVRGIDGLRIGVPHEYFLTSELLDQEVRGAVLSAAAELERAGATLTEVEVPNAAAANEANHITFLCEAFAYHHADLVHRWHEYGRPTRELLARAAFFTGADYVQAQRLRSLFRRDMAGVFTEVDALLTPAALTPAAPIAQADFVAALTRPGFYGPWNAAGLPAIVVPCGFTTTGLPVAFQLIGPVFGESVVLRLAHAYQQRTEWHLHVPPTADL